MKKLNKIRQREAFKKIPNVKALKLSVQMNSKYNLINLSSIMSKIDCNRFNWDLYNIYSKKDIQFLGRCKSLKCLIHFPCPYDTEQQKNI